MSTAIYGHNDRHITTHDHSDHSVVYNTTVFVNGISEENTEINQWKDRLISILERVPARLDDLTPIVQLLVLALAPSKIYVINRPSFNVPDLGSYIDLLIIVSSRCQVPFLELEPVLEMAYLKDKRICCSLHNEGNVILGIRNGHIFYSLHCIPDNLIYDDMASIIPLSSPEVLTKVKERTRERFNSFFQKALHFYRGAVSLHKDDNSLITAFMLHQAVELTYRGILQCLNVYEKRTHEIRSLKIHARRTTPQLNSVFPDNTEKEKHLLDLLDGAYLGCRYEDHYNIEETDIQIIFERVRQFQIIAAQIIEAALGNPSFPMRKLHE